MSPVRPIDFVKILQQSEIAAIVQDLKRKGKRSRNSQQNLIIFRLSTCCGLRVSEIVGLKMANVVTGTAQPHIHVPKDIAKRRKQRKVPLLWDAGTLADFETWKKSRIEQGAGPGDPFVCAQATGKHAQTGKATFGKPLSVRNAQFRFQAAIKVLGTERADQLSIHCGRHSFCSHALAGGIDLARVRDAAGHANIATTSIYLHAIDDGKVTNLFPVQ